MTKRDELLEAQEEYWGKVRALKKPGEVYYKLSVDNGNTTPQNKGHLIYDSEKDIVTICLPCPKNMIYGKYLKSLYSALGDLVGDQNRSDKWNDNDDILGFKANAAEGDRVDSYIRREEER
jgi:hypothetical protein